MERPKIERPSLRDRRRALLALSRWRPETDEALNAFEDFERRPDPGFEDRAVVLVSATLLEQVLELAILAHCRPMEPGQEQRLFGSDRESFVSNLYGKTILAYALRMLDDDMLSDLDRIREIRNQFAHSALRIDFGTPEVADLCEFNVIDAMRRRSSEPVERVDTPKKAFLGAASLTYLFILLNIKDFGDSVAGEEGTGIEDHPPGEPSP